MSTSCWKLHTSKSSRTSCAVRWSLSKKRATTDASLTYGGEATPHQPIEPAWQPTEDCALVAALVHTRFGTARAACGTLQVGEFPRTHAPSGCFRAAITTHDGNKKKRKTKTTRRVEHQDVKKREQVEGKHTRARSMHKHTK